MRPQVIIRKPSIPNLAGRPANAPVDQRKTRSLQNLQVAFDPQMPGLPIEFSEDAQAEPARPAIPLERRQPRGETAFQAMNRRTIARKARESMVDQGLMRHFARGVLSGSSRSLEAGGRRGAAAKYLGRQLAAAVLDDDVSDEDFVALLLPVKGMPQSAEEFAQQLQKQNDPQEMKEMLDGILQGQKLLPTDADELFDLLKDVRWNPKELMELMRLALDLKEPARLRTAMRGSIDNEIREMEKTPEGGKALLTVNTAKIAAHSGDPVKFQDTYEMLLSKADEFMDALQVLLTQYSVPALLEVVDLMKKALADDLAATTPSCPTAQLRHIMTSMANMHSLQSWINIFEAKIQVRLEKSQLDDLTPAPIDMHLLFKRVVEMIARGNALAQQFSMLASDLGISRGRASVVFLTGLLESLRSIPNRLYAEDTFRPALVEAAKGALSNAIEDEEDAQDEMESNAAIPKATQEVH